LQVPGELINDKGKLVKDGAVLKPGQWGCWRSHVNLWRKIVKENIDSALIMEDDLNWDISIHDVFYRLALQMRTSGLRNSTMTEYEESSAPYGMAFS
jgi:hypothetical protein